MAKKVSSEPVSQPEAVNAFLKACDHPLLELMKQLRDIILSADPHIGEEIKWNAPSFFYTGPMAPFKPKEYKRDIVVFNLFKKDSIRLIFPTGAKIPDSFGLLGGKFSDGRKMAEFHSLEEAQQRKQDLTQCIQAWLQLIEK